MGPLACRVGRVAHTPCVSVPLDSRPLVTLPAAVAAATHNHGTAPHFSQHAVDTPMGGKTRITASGPAEHARHSALAYHHRESHQCPTPTAPPTGTTASNAAPAPAPPSPRRPRGTCPRNGRSGTWRRQPPWSHTPCQPSRRSPDRRLPRLPPPLWPLPPRRAPRT